MNRFGLFLFCNRSANRLSHADQSPRRISKRHTNALNVLSDRASVLAVCARFKRFRQPLSQNFSLPWGWTRLFGPLAIAQWFLSYTDWHTAASASLFCFCVASLLGALGFLGMQVRLSPFSLTNMLRFTTRTMATQCTNTTVPS